MRPPNLWSWLTALPFLLGLISCQQEYDPYQEFITTESERGLFPSIFNLATNSLINATSTCGYTRREEYCKLVEHVLLRKTTTVASPQCDICDANDPQHRHPIEFAIDGTKRWWQSPSLANGLQYEKVNITIDLRQEYQVAYVVVKMGNTPRPGTWVLEKSLDGVNYEPWQYYATSDAECMRQFGVPATTGVPRFQRDDEVHCTSEYSKITPLEGGEIHTSLVNGRPGVEKPSLELQKFTRARFVRLRLISPRTLNADLMIINQQTHRIDKSVTMRYFYSISDISIGGQCICYGHAESCPSDPVTGQFKCECRHNTCGESCNRCCPLFNQLPWKPGINSHPNACQQCQCFNHADSCVYDEELDNNKWSITPEGVYEGGGRCVDCKHNTEGFNCERCKDGFYRPSGLSHYREDACRTCDCDLTGSISDVCIRDDQSALSGQHPGDCVCKPGFGGRRCERCARGYRNYPKCEPCPCNQAGSVNFDTCEEENCQCKANVEGLYCDRCRAGTIHLNANNPLGCQACFCFGMTDKCKEIPWVTAAISNNVGWNLTDLSGERNVRPEIENREVLMFNANQNKDHSLFYWKAPDTFTGNMLNSYGGNLHFYVYYVPIEPGNSVPVADLVIEGNGIKVEYYTRMDFFPRENMTVQIPIREGAGWYNSMTRTPAEKADMMRALAGVEKFLVRAMYQQNQLQSSIFGLTLDTAVPPPEGRPPDHAKEDVLHPTMIDTRMRGVEVCECPENFAGNSCESCVAGYRRVNNQLYGGRCEKCSCQGHTDTCDPFTGACTNCQHNTTGPRCELCLPGHYGNPSLGGELGACRPCACPTPENSHSSECVMTQLVVAGPAASLEDAYVCTACERGYEGNKCEVCADGFFGNPMDVNGTCKECECNDNIDLMAIGNCDTETGRCLKCIGDTTGEHCEICKENHWGSALQHTCKPCGCHHVGALAPQCNNVNGECSCKTNYIGKQCDRCMDGHGDIENGCPPCECNNIGSIGEQCDAVSGQCTCKQGVFGKRCDQCRPSYFNFTDAGCQFCHCNIYGSMEDGKCNNVTGKCECRENVDGTMCEKCASGFFNITSGTGCQACDCDPNGSDGEACDLHSGQCVCKPGVTGLKCDRCLPNHYGLDEHGCKECQACPAPGQVCDPITGDCVCPPNTVGRMCENCTENAWDYHPLKGCKLCDCSEVGSNNGKCDMRTGQCKCRNEYVGLRCDRCTHGFFGFPDCKACDCDPAGTDPLQCKEGLCLCNENGECPCKKNVQGAKCDQCKPSTFSLEMSNRLGCTDCFCFNRTTVCEQSTLVWQQTYAEDRRAIFEEPWEYYTKKHNLNLLKDYPAQFNSYPTDVVPLYWPLPKSMLGDRTSSYNGFLRFRIWNEDNRRGIEGVRPDNQYFRYFPQVVLVGNNRIELEHIPTAIVEDGKYKVRLHESEWRSRQSPELPVTRKEMMIALQNLQGVYIRGTYNYPARGDAISMSEISLDVAVPASSDRPASTAIGVEQCSDCPQGFTGASCQNPAQGYCRKRQRDYLNSPDDMSLIGWSEPCACYGHSVSCHPETCICTDCEHNTYGDHCDYCKTGYIGDAREGGAKACTKCACPLVENSFSDTCVAVDYGRGYVCNACKPGYTGQYCESCMVGYFGEPSIPGGFCQSCDCHPDGSLHGACNPHSGQCECRNGVTGRDCSQCQHRHAFIGGVCTSCDQGCYLPLMTMVDELEMTLANQNFSSLRPIPWKRLSRIGNNTELISEFMRRLIDDGEVSGIVKDNKYAKEAFAIVEGARFQSDRITKGLTSLEQVTALTEKLIRDAQLTYGNAFNTVQFLKQFHLYGGKSVGGSTLDAWALEAEAHYNATLDRGEYIEKRLNRAEQEHKKNEELLKKVFSNKLNETSFENILNRLEEFDQWLEDYRATIYDSARRDTLEANRMSNVVAKRIDRYKEVSNEIDRLRAEAEDDLATARNAVDSAKGKELLNLFDDSRAINETLGKVSEMSSLFRNKSTMYAQLIDEYDEVFVQKATAHAEKLEESGELLKNSFKDTKTEAENPLKASHSYEEIAGALINATKAADLAVKAAEDAYAEADGDPENSMVKQVGESKKKSQALAEEAAKQRKEWESMTMEQQRESLDERLASVNEQNIDAIKRSDNVKNQWSKFDDHHDRTIGLQSVARDADKRAEMVQVATNALVNEAKDVVERTNKLLNSTGQGIREEIDKVRKSRLDLEKNCAALENVGKVIAENRNRADEMQKQLALLRDKINEAREKAQQIRISLRSDERGICQRLFTSPAHPSPSNSFSIRYRPLRNVPNSAIFVTRTKPRRTQASEFIAIEIRDKRVVAHWNVGGGTRMATNSHSILFIPNTDRSNWYHIDVVRIGNALNLTVALKETVTGAPDRLRTDPVSVFVGDEEWDGDVVFNTIPGETQISMGTDEDSANEMGLATNKFHGTIGSLVVDDVSVPLWAFSSNSLECEGAVSPPQPTVRGYMFRDGFAQVELATFERTVSSLSVVFNTYSPNGLLYFRGSETSGDFIALYLKDGHVVFKINLGGSSHAELISKGTYADGREHTVKAIRSGGEIHLQVDSDADRFSTTITGEHTALNIETDSHYVAGVPTSLKTERFNSDIQWKGFFGCILRVKPSQASDLDLDHPVRWQRRDPGCQFSETERSRLASSDRLIGFSRPGYLLQRGLIMDNNSTFAFGFRTKEENGTLIFQSSRLSTFHRKQRSSDENGKGYLAFYLFRGYLVLHFGKDASSRKEVVTIRSNQMYNDGQLHSVFMSRKGKIVRLRVDDKEIGEKQTLHDESPIGTASSQMFIGGFAERSKPPNNEIPTTVPLIGCISDMYHNYKKIAIVPEEHNAQIGICAIQSPTFSSPIDEPLDLENYKGHRKDSRLNHQLDRNHYETEKEKMVHPVDNTSTKETMITCADGFGSAVRDGDGAVRFGISRSSHSRVNFEGKQYPNISNFQISLSMRTKQETGMIWMWANYKNFTRYFYMQLIEGYPTIEVKGRHPRAKILKNEERRLDDGHWHDIVIIKKERELTMTVDELAPVSISDCPSPKVMRRRIYIGGVISKHRSSFDLKTPGYDGCIRELKVNNVLQNLEGESSRDIVPCGRPTKGMYAHEGGFAVFDGLQKSIKNGSRYIDIALSFRPIVDEGTVVALLTNSNPEAARLTIEVKQNKVFVTVIHEASGLEIRDAIPVLRPLCDGTWHSLHLSVGDKTMEITIDNERNEIPVDHMSSATRDLLLNLPINIAGVAAPVAEKLSMTSLVGCYRELKLAGHPKYFENALKNNKVVVDGCPFH